MNTFCINSSIFLLYLTQLVYTVVNIHIYNIFFKKVVFM